MIRLFVISGTPTCRPATGQRGRGYFYGKEGLPMFVFNCIMALAKEFPSFVDLIVRHALEILGAM
jgi:hypothetical protein